MSNVRPTHGGTSLRRLPLITCFLLFLLSVDSCASAQRPVALTLDPDSIALRQLRPGVWLHTSYYPYPDGTRFPSNGLVVQDGAGLLLVDSAWGEIQTAALLARISRDLHSPVLRALITHAHGDRIAGVDHLRERGIPVYALPESVRLAGENGLPMPSESLSGLDAPGSARTFGSVELFYPGPGHSPDNLMVWVARGRVLFAGCAVRALDAASLGNRAHADLSTWPRAIERALARYPTAEIVVPGHGEPGTLRLLHHTLRLFPK